MEWVIISQDIMITFEQELPPPKGDPVPGHPCALLITSQVWTDKLFVSGILSHLVGTRCKLKLLIDSRFVSQEILGNLVLQVLVLMLLCNQRYPDRQTSKLRPQNHETHSKA